MNAVWLLIGLLLGAGAGALLRRPSARMEQIQDGLARVDQHLRVLEGERRETRGRLEAQLQQLARSGEQLRTETGALVTALRKPNVRGQWGQMQLRRVVELAGMIPHCDFEEQVTLRAADGPLRPDLVIRLPGGAQVAVDAKTPLQAVLDAYEARDEAERAAHLRAHARLLRAHVERLASREYAAHLRSAAGLVVLFLPGEHLYGAALEAEPALLQDAMARGVVIATPTTLLALLHAVAHGWQGERLAASAAAVAEQGRELHRRLERLAALLGTLGARLGSAVGAYNEAVGSYESRVLPAGRRLAEHCGAPDADDEAPAPITVAPRSLRRQPPARATSA